MKTHVNKLHIVSTITFILFLMLLFGCGRVVPKIHINKTSGGTVTLEVDVAKTPVQRTLGLMYRKSMPKNKGMLFIFDEEKTQNFTMKNTYIPLDMIFINRTKEIVGWVENTKPLTEGPFKIEKPSLYVLEVNAFFCKINGIAVGDKVSFENFPK